MSDEHECNLCGSTFDSEEELQTHNQEEHRDEM
ncbi:C2H2-type zinc finger protein [Natronosalvus halobius]